MAASSASYGEPRPRRSVQGPMSSIAVASRASRSASAATTSGVIAPCSARSALHRAKELVVGLRVLHLVDEELDRGELVHRVQQLAQDPDLLQLVLRGDQLLLARAGAVDVDRRIDALLSDAPVEVDLGVAGALELLVDHVVHARAGVDQRGRDDRQRAALLDVARRAEEALRALQRVRVDT